MDTTNRIDALLSATADLDDGTAHDVAYRAHPDALRWLRRVPPQGVAVTRRAVRSGRRAEAWRELGCLALSHYADGVAHYALTDKGRAVLSASHAVRTYEVVPVPEPSSALWEKLFMFFLPACFEVPVEAPTEQERLCVRVTAAKRMADAALAIVRGRS